MCLRPERSPVDAQRECTNVGCITTESGQEPDVSLATTDIILGHNSILKLTKQLNSFRSKDLFLGRFRMLGHNERRRGGAVLRPCLARRLCMSMSSSGAQKL
jgi:hypothetical protein